MKPTLTRMLVLSCCLFGGSLFGQRYLTPQFIEVDVQANVRYAANYTVLTVPETGNATLRPLLMDVYSPTGDTESDRPLVLLFGTGNFIPQGMNGTVFGSRSDSVNVEIATRLARLGYVVAVADYRRGWNPVSEEIHLRQGSYLQALYRGQHDARAAIRFFRKSAAEENNPFGVCGDRIALWGIGTGGNVALAAGYLDVYVDVLRPKFLYLAPSSDIPDPYIFDFIHGNIEGDELTIFPDLGSDVLSGDTMNIVNHSGYSSEVQLVVNMSGTIGDSSWIDASDPPLIGFHSPTDMINPYATGIAITTIPEGASPFEVSGSFDAVRIANELGINDVLGDAGISDVYTTAANNKNMGVGNLFPYAAELVPNIYDSLVFVNYPYHWWDSDYWQTVPYTDELFTYCPLLSPTNSCNLDNVTALLNPVNSADAARAVIDTTINYFAPRAFNALNLGEGCSFVDTDDLPAAVARLTAMPNPAREAITIGTDSDMLMRSVSVVDLQGRLISIRQNLATRQIVLERNRLPAGIYYVRVQFDEGLATQRVVFE